MTRPTQQSDVILAHRVALKLHIVFCASYTQCWRKLLQHSIRSKCRSRLGVVETASKTSLPVKGPDFGPLAAVVSHLIYQKGVTRGRREQRHEHVSSQRSRYSGV
jgi:hypothetical protein